MVNQPKKPLDNRTRDNRTQDSATRDNGTDSDISRDLVNKMKGFSDGLKSYLIRDLVKDAELFGSYLKQRKLETNQIRKFLDAINRIKADLPEDSDFAKIEVDIVLLKPKLAYAAARQAPAKPLSDVMSAAIDKVHNREDFDRLVQFIESIIAYHKAEGGK
jgi:CRISPR-associated protein Csm2